MARTVESGWSYIKKPLTRVRKLNLWACKLRDSEFMQIMSGVLLLYDVDNAGVTDGLKRKGCFFLNCYAF